MSELVKATLTELDDKGKPKSGTEVKVQFNPTTLRLQMANSVDTGKSKGRQTWRYNGTSSTTLTVELEFDSADENSGGKPVDVRERTETVRRFMLPAEKSTKAPPRVRFHWGTFTLDGVMVSASEDLDLFAPTGTPLRAKMSLQIKEQDPRFTAADKTKDPPITAPNPASPPPFGPGGAGLPASAADQVAEALDGESAADFLTRNGLNPEAWRAVANSVGDALNLLGGQPIGFSLDLPLGGLSLGGFSVGLEVGVEAQLGLSGGDASAGFAMAAAGGLSAAVQREATTVAATAADATRADFGVAASGGTTASAGGAPAAASRQRLRDSSTVRAGAAAAITVGAPLAPAADTRSTSYGRGVPLRDRVSPADIGGARQPWAVVATRSPRPAGASASHGRSGSCSCQRCDPRGGR